MGTLGQVGSKVAGAPAVAAQLERSGGRVVGAWKALTQAREDLRGLARVTAEATDLGQREQRRRRTGSGQLSDASPIRTLVRGGVLAAAAELFPARGSAVQRRTLRPSIAI